MNPWGIVVIAVGLVVAWVGVRGTQGSIYADIFGQPYKASGTGPSSLHPITSLALPPGASIGTYGPNGGAGNPGASNSGGITNPGGSLNIPGGVAIPGGSLSI